MLTLPRNSLLLDGVIVRPVGIVRKVAACIQPHEDYVRLEIGEVGVRYFLNASIFVPYCPASILPEFFFKLKEVLIHACFLILCEPRIAAKGHFTSTHFFTLVNVIVGSAIDVASRR